jgi:ATP-binding cassette subfamily B protein RaxB
MRTDALRLSPFGRPRVPLVLQSEAAECALACLTMVVGAHGHRTDLATLRQRFSLSLKGATMADLVRMAGELNFNPRALRVEPAQLEQLALPCVLHWDLNHFVVLTEVKGQTVTLHDPARGVRHLPRCRSTSPGSRSSCRRRRTSHRRSSARPSSCST